MDESALDYIVLVETTSELQVALRLGAAHIHLTEHLRPDDVGPSASDTPVAVASPSVGSPGDEQGGDGDHPGAVSVGAAPTVSTPVATSAPDAGSGTDGSRLLRVARRRRLQQQSPSQPSASSGTAAMHAAADAPGEAGMNVPTAPASPRAAGARLDMSANFDIKLATRSVLGGCLPWGQADRGCGPGRCFHDAPCKITSSRTIFGVATTSQVVLGNLELEVLCAPHSAAFVGAVAITGALASVWMDRVAFHSGCGALYVGGSAEDDVANAGGALPLPGAGGAARNAYAWVNDCVFNQSSGAGAPAMHLRSGSSTALHNTRFFGAPAGPGVVALESPDAALLLNRSSFRPFERPLALQTCPEALAAVNAVAYKVFNAGSNISNVQCIGQRTWLEVRSANRLPAAEQELGFVFADVSYMDVVRQELESADRRVLGDGNWLLNLQSVADSDINNLPPPSPDVAHRPAVDAAPAAAGGHPRSFSSPPGGVRHTSSALLLVAVLSSTVFTVLVATVALLVVAKRRRAARNEASDGLGLQSQATGPTNEATPVMSGAQEGQLPGEEAPQETIEATLDRLHEGRELLLGKYLVYSFAERRRCPNVVLQFAQNVPDSKEVVLKFFSDRSAFRREIQLYRNADLGSIMPRIELDEPNTLGRLRSNTGFCYPPLLVVERGTDLNSWMSSVMPDFGAVVSVLVKLAAVLEKLHRQGLCYRNLKPSNILWHCHAEAWTLLDFGCSAVIGNTARLIYTLPYASPEAVNAAEAEHETIQAEAASDVWALGIIAVELVTGCGVFPAGMAKKDIRDQISGRRPLPWEDERQQEGVLRALGPLERTVLRCLSRDASERPPAAQLHVAWAAVAREAGAGLQGALRTGALEGEALVCVEETQSTMVTMPDEAEFDVS